MTTLDYLPWHRPTAYDDQPCVRDDANDLTYAEFGAWVDAAAEQFADYGVSPGSVVAIMLPNRVELLVAIVAAWRLGAGRDPDQPGLHRQRGGLPDRRRRTQSWSSTPDPRRPDGGRPSIAVDELDGVRSGAIAASGAGDHARRPRAADLHQRVDRADPRA